MKTTLFMLMFIASNVVFGQEDSFIIDLFNMIDNPLKMEINSEKLDSISILRPSEFNRTEEYHNNEKTGKWTEYSYDSWEYYESLDEIDSLNLNGAIEILPVKRIVEFTLKREVGLYRENKKSGKWTVWETNLRDSIPQWIKTKEIDYSGENTKIVMSYWNNGNVRYNAIFRNDRLDDNFVLYWNTGKKWMDGTFEDGNQIEFKEYEP